MSRKTNATGGISRATAPGGNPKNEGNKAGPFPSTYFGNSRACDTDRYEKGGQNGGGNTRKGR